MCNIPHCCLPQEFGPCLSPNVAVRPLRPATDRRFGGPLPRQLANRTRVHRTPSELPQAFHPAPCGAVCICGISSRFRLLSPCVRQVTHALLTRPPLTRSSLGFGTCPFDLHVLGTPPAFILSQDQTLMFLHAKESTCSKSDFTLQVTLLFEILPGSESFLAFFDPLPSEVSLFRFLVFSFYCFKVFVTFLSLSVL